MSWSIGPMIGKPQAVADRVAVDAGYSRCYEPENTIKKSFVEAIVGALAAYPPGSVVRVSASGSQTGVHDGGKAANSLKIEIEALAGFVE